MTDGKHTVLRRAEDIVHSAQCRYLQAQLDAMRALDELRRCNGEGIDRASDAYKNASAAEREAKAEYEQARKLLDEAQS